MFSFIIRSLSSYIYNIIQVISLSESRTMVKKSPAAMARLNSLCFVFFLDAVLLSSLLFCSGTKSGHSSKHVAFFIFGDSFLDSGNNNYINTTTLDQANFWPYGETYFKFPTGRFSDGRLISDFIGKLYRFAYLL